MKPSIETLYEVLDFTWPSVTTELHHGWQIKNGSGGGKRVSAAIQNSPTAKVEVAEKLMNALGQKKLFMIREGNEILDYKLHKLGYKLIDPSVIFGLPIELLAKTFDGKFHTSPNTAMKSLWLNGDINDMRLNVMARTKVLKTYVTINNIAVAFVAIHNAIAMVHALEVSTINQRQGFGKKIMQQIAGWASLNGAHYLSVITVHNNFPAKSLYEHLKMSEIGSYHYRIKL